MFQFEIALMMLREGEKVTQSNWNRGEFLFIPRGVFEYPTIWHHTLRKPPRRWDPLQRDILATNWIKLDASAD